MVEIRMAGPADEEGIVALCKAMHEEVGTRSLSENKVRNEIHSALYNRQGIIGVVGPSDDIQALIFLKISSCWYSDDLEISDLMTFVRKDCRRSTIAKSLIQFAKDCADKISMPLYIGVVSTVRTEAKVRLYRRQVPKVGEFFCHLPEMRN